MLHSLSSGILVLTLASTSSAHSAAQGQVHVVGPGGFSQIQSAVNAAHDGDTVLVRVPIATLFNAIDVAGKALTIAADSSTAFARVRSVRVHDVPAGKTVVLSRLQVEAPGFFEHAPGFLLQNNAGSARLVSCQAFAGFVYGYVPQGMRIESSNGSTAMASCTLLGSDASYRDIKYAPDRGGAGLEVVDSVAAVFDSKISGGESSLMTPLFYLPARGGVGVSVVHAALPTRLLLANSSIQGGRGSGLFSCYHFTPSSGPGGPGLVVGAGATVTRLASTIAGGQGGATPPCGVPGLPGPVFVNNGTLNTNPTTALQLTTPTVARESKTITLTFRGVAGDRVMLIVGSETAFQERPDGILLVQSGRGMLPIRGLVGTIGASGVLSVPYTVPTLPLGIEATNLWFQGLALHANGKRTLGSFSVVTVLDAVY